MSVSKKATPVEVKPAKSLRYEECFKRDAVRLVTEEKYSFAAAAAAAAVGVTDQTLRAWHKKFAPPPTPCGENATAAELQAEVQRLQKALRRAEMERDILKKAAAYFAQESL